MRRAIEIRLDADERKRIEKLVKAPATRQGIAKRLRAVLYAGRGWENQRIARALKMGINGVARWRLRYVETGVMGVLSDRERSGRPPQIDRERVEAIVKKTLSELPAARTHWSRASMAKAVGVSPSTVGRIWRSHGLKPHRVKTFKLSRDPAFVEKMEDVVGLYLAPPVNAVVFCADEKTQVQALDRTQPGLPLKKGRAGTMTHDYKRNGTTTLFAALNVLTGVVISQFHQKHTNKEWLLFLKEIEAQTPKDKSIHVICDNYATHKHPRVRAWLKRNPRVHQHFTPTSSSWLNMVERFFRDVTENAIRRGAFTSVPDLIDAIDRYLIEHNRDPKPFIWTASAKDILAKVMRAQQALHARVRSLSAVAGA